MKNLLLFLFLFSSIFSYSQNLPPEINNLNIVDNGDLSITVTYDLIDNEGDECMVSLQVIDENDHAIQVMNNTSGDINTMVEIGTGKSFTWAYNNELNTSGNFIFKLVADDLVTINIQEIVDQVDSTLLYADLEIIEGIRHRNTGLDHLLEVREMITDRMESYNFVSETQEFTYEGFTGKNFIVNSLGTQNQNEVYVLCGHYDSVFDSPGADDNGSAIAGMMEAMRLLAPYNFKKTIRYIAFDLEEPGLKGSIDYVSNCLPAFDNIAGVLDFEMIGYYTNEPNSQNFPFGFNSLFPEPYAQVQADDFRGNFIANIAKVGQNDWELAYENAAATYVPNLKVVTIVAPDNWQVITPDLGRSDHAPFWVAEYPAVMLSGTANFRNQNYHTPNDTIETLNFTFMSNVVKATVATLAEEAEIQHSGLAVESINLEVNGVGEMEKLNFQIFPNPASSSFEIECKFHIQNLKIIDNEGKTVLEQKNPAKEIDVSNLKTGVYIIVAATRKGDIINQLVIE